MPTLLRTPIGRPSRLRGLVLASACVLACADGDSDGDDMPAATGGIATTNADGASGSGSGDGTAGPDDGGPTPTSDGGTADGGESGGSSGTGSEPEVCDEPALPAASFATDIYTPIIAESCSCHVVGTQSGLTMPDAATALTNLVNGVGTTQLELVIPGDRNASYLWAKINGTADEVRGGGGGQMPLGGVLTCDQIEAIGAWIDAGAMP